MPSMQFSTQGTQLVSGVWSFGLLAWKLLQGGKYAWGCAGMMHFWRGQFDFHFYLTNLLSQHSVDCGSGTAIFLAVNSSTIIVIRGKRACLWGSVYLDAFGEEDRELKWVLYVLYNHWAPSSLILLSGEVSLCTWVKSAMPCWRVSGCHTDLTTPIRNGYGTETYCKLGYENQFPISYFNHLMKSGCAELLLLLCNGSG